MKDVLLIADLEDLHQINHGVIDHIQIDARCVTLNIQLPVLAVRTVSMPDNAWRNAFVKLAVRFHGVSDFSETVLKPSAAPSIDNWIGADILSWGAIDFHFSVDCFLERIEFRYDRVTIE